MKPRILSGYRATGKVHIGNLFGTLTNWVKFQENYDCFYEVADLHALTTREDNDDMKTKIRELVTDWLACGLDPEKSTIFVQSAIPEHYELHLFFSMLVPVPWLERNPTLKEQIRDLHLDNKINYGFLGYPVLQAADILIYKANAVPVGEDQAPHVEMTREIARKFNSIYKPIFPEPETLLSKASRVPGLDRAKMSKSLNNAILIDDNPDDIKGKMQKAFTDPLKIHKDDKGHPEGCVVFAYHKLVNPEADWVKEECMEGKIGCVGCKKIIAELMTNFLAPYKDTRRGIKQKHVDEILTEGIKKAKKVASKTIKEVKSAMHLW